MAATTQQHIAERLNISRSLVARVLSNTPGVRVADSTRRQILHTARELGYRPNTAARSLRTGKTHTVTFVQVSPESRHSPNSYIAGIEGAAHALARLGYELKLRANEHPSQLVDALRDMASSRATDAAILWGNEEDVEPMGQLLADFGFPFVAKGRHEIVHPEWPQIDFDHEKMMEIAVEFLAGLGHQNIAFIGYNSQAIFSQRLKAGFESAYERIVDAPCREDMIAELHPSPRAAENVVLEWLKRPKSDLPTAIVNGAGDLIWRGIELALARYGRVIGEGDEDMPVIGIAGPGFTTLFGKGRCFFASDLQLLASETVTRLIAPLLEGRAPEPKIVRLCPNLEPTPCMGLTEYVTLKSLDGAN